MDTLSVAWMQLSDDPEDGVWVRWQWAQPTARPLPFMHLFTFRLWDDTERNPLSGPHVRLEGAQFRREQTSPHPGTDYRGEIDWWQNGLPPAARAAGDVVQVCGGEAWAPVLPVSFGLGVAFDTARARLGLRVTGAAPGPAAEATASLALAAGATMAGPAAAGGAALSLVAAWVASPPPVSAAPRLSLGAGAVSSGPSAAGAAGVALGALASLGAPVAAAGPALAMAAAGVTAGPASVSPPALALAAASFVEGTRWEDFAVLGTSLLTAQSLTNPSGTSLTASTWYYVYALSGTVSVELPSPGADVMSGVEVVPGSAVLLTVAAPAGSSIDGEASVTLWSGEAAVFQSDGSVWKRVAGTAKAMACQIAASTNQAGIVSAALTGVTFGTADVDNTGLMADVANNRIVIKRAGTYLIGGNVYYQPFATAAGTAYTIIRKNGGTVAVNEKLNAVNEAGGPPVAELITLAAGDLLTLVAFHNSGVNQSAYGGAVTGSRSTLYAVEVPRW